MTTKIITDSGCDLPKEIIDGYNIDVIPLYVYENDIEFLDGETMDPVDLYNGMRKKKIYKTAQIPPSKFKDVFIKYAQDKVNCIYIGFSSGLSGTYQSALIARNEILEDYPDSHIKIVDSKCAATGLGLVVYKAAKMAGEGKSKDEILQAIEFYSKHMEHIFMVDNLETLFRGGRLSRTAAVLGGILNIKPILNIEDGKLIPIDKVRGRKKFFKRIIEIITDRGVDLENQTIGICHGDDLEGAEELKKLIQEEFRCKEIVISIIGGAIGAHTGPGILAVVFLNEKAPM